MFGDSNSNSRLVHVMFGDSNSNSRLVVHVVFVVVYFNLLFCC